MNFKYITYIILFISFFLNQLDAGCGSCSAHRKKTKKAVAEVVIPSNAEMAKISLPTIMCGMCEANIKDAFSSTNGIFKVNVDLDSKSGQVFYNSKKVSLAQIETAISNAGYKANKKEAVKAAYDKLPRCCKIDG